MAAILFGSTSALVDELAEQQLGVADLVADVHQVDVALRASGRVGVADAWVRQDSPKPRWLSE